MINTIKDKYFSHKNVLALAFRTKHLIKHLFITLFAMITKFSTIHFAIHYGHHFKNMVLLLICIFVTMLLFVCICYMPVYAFGCFELSVLPIAPKVMNRKS